mmetsp:Transcript_6923/g.19728  ORF Transcript_6923/g.19728 Transcript_6923/m.19728 type:complete len:201 (-) Transcript_6923:147-749(-)
MDVRGGELRRRSTLPVADEIEAKWRLPVLRDDRAEGHKGLSERSRVLHYTACHSAHICLLDILLPHGADPEPAWADGVAGRLVRSGYRLGQVPVRAARALRPRGAGRGRDLLDAVGGLHPVLEGGADRRLRDEHKDGGTAELQRDIVGPGVGVLGRLLRLLVLLLGRATLVLWPEAGKHLEGIGGGHQQQDGLRPGGLLL